MLKDNLSRRNFLTNLVFTGALAGTQLSPLTGMARATAVSNEPDFKPRSPDAQLKIVCTQKFTEAEVAKIKSGGKNISMVMLDGSKDPKHFADAEVIIGSVDGPVLLQAKNLKWMQALGAGVENMPAELIEHPCILTNMQRIYAPVIAESAIALLLSLTRGLTQLSIPAFRERKWAETDNTIVLDDLYNKTIGIVGMGGIGSETARRLHYGFQMRVLATDVKPLPRPEFVAELHDPSWLMEMVPQVDVLMSAAPLTKETRKMFNEQVFRKMKPSAYFINVTRGGLVDQEALVAALKEKRIRGAGLDVTSPEPLPSDSPLWSCPNLVITPHNSGEAPIRQIRHVALIAENVRRYSLNLPLLNVVDKHKGY